MYKVVKKYGRAPVCLPNKMDSGEDLSEESATNIDGSDVLLYYDKDARDIGGGITIRLEPDRKTYSYSDLDYSTIIRKVTVEHQGLTEPEFVKWVDTVFNIKDPVTYMNGWHTGDYQVQ